jgi:hypothetical protein
MVVVALNTTPIPDTWEATAELWIGNGDVVEIVVGSVDEEGAKEVIARMRRALAFLGLCGEMLVAVDVDVYGEERKEEALRVIEKLSEQDRTITWNDVRRVNQEAEEEARRVERGFGKLAGFMKEEGLKRGLNKEEREKLTLGEALKDAGTEDEGD